jgi:hypothetical protein
MTLYRDFEQADAFTTGVIGLPGARTFFLQVGDAGEMLTMKCEKEQIMALSAYLRKTLEDAPAVAEHGAGGRDFVEPGDVRIRVSRAQASAFCDQAERLVKAGRPPCHFCGLPVNRDGHACPRMN